MKKFLFPLFLAVGLLISACQPETGCSDCGTYANENDPTWTFEMREDSTWTIVYPADHHRTVEHGNWERRGDILVRLTRADNKKVFRDIQWNEGKWGFEEYGWFEKTN